MCACTHIHTHTQQGSDSQHRQGCWASGRHRIGREIYWALHSVIRKVTCASTTTAPAAHTESLQPAELGVGSRCLSCLGSPHGLPNSSAPVTSFSALRVLHPKHPIGGMPCFPGLHPRETQSQSPKKIAIQPRGHHETNLWTLDCPYSSYHFHLSLRFPDSVLHCFVFSLQQLHKDWGFGRG